MMEANGLGFCSEHAISLWAMNVLLWTRQEQKKKKIKRKPHTQKKHSSLASQRNILTYL